MPVTNRGKRVILEEFFRNPTEFTNLFAVLCTSTTTPTVDTNTLSELTQIASGNGYTTNGISLSRNSTDFDVLTEDDTLDRAFIQIRDLVWTASVGSLPASGLGARWAALTDDNVTPGSRQVIAYWDLVSDRTVSVGQTLTLVDCEIRGTE